MQRIEAANRERVAKHEEHAKAVRRYDDHVAKLEARRELRQSLIKAEREAFQQQQAAMNDALRKSEAGTAVITDSELEAIITGEGAQEVGTTRLGTVRMARARARAGEQGGQEADVDVHQQRVRCARAAPAERPRKRDATRRADERVVLVCGRTD